MDKEFILSQYSSLGIHSQDDLYNFMVNNTKATIEDINYHLRSSNESMEFMANFLSALNFKVVRLYLDKNDYDYRKHCWFLIFNDGFKWFYYEVCLDEIKGEYSFETYTEAVAFAATKIIKALEKNEISDADIENKYFLKEIKPLQNFGLYANIKSSEKGHEILCWSSNNIIKTNSTSQEQHTETIKGRSKGINTLSFIIGFVITFVVGIGLIYLLSQIYYRKL